MLKQFLTAPFFVTVIRYCWCSDEETIDYYEKLIQDAKTEAENYELPTNAYQFIPQYDGPATEFGTFDFIIVGSGSTGSVIARRLSEVEDWNILVLEAGEFGNEITDIPRMTNDVTMLSDYNWGYYSVPQKNCCWGMLEHSCVYSKGKGVGGTSLLNGLAYTLGNKIDYDTWCAQGNSGWCYEDVLPYFKKSEDFHNNDPDAVVDMDYHGDDGPLYNNFLLPRAEQCKVFFRAHEELGYNQTDCNQPYPIGISPYQANVKQGKRHDSGTAFVKPVLNRTNLEVLTGSFVTKLIINETVAEGVVFSYNETEYQAFASKEVIVSAGTFGSPQLLMVSGIGPSEHLEELGITVIQDLEVGSTLSDHIQLYGLTFSSNLSEPVQTLREQIQDFLNGYGLLAHPSNREVFSYIQTPVETVPLYQDLEMAFSFSNSSGAASSKIQRWNETISSAFQGVNSSSSFSMFPSVLHTKSTGTLRLSSSSPFDYPLIDHNCFSDPEGKDLETAYQSVLFILELLETEAFKEINAKLETKPIAECSDKFEFMSKDYWYCALKYMAGHNNHPVGTCRMGPDPENGDVVDSQLKVYGIEKLRVADSSVIPFSTSAHTNSICYMIGEKLSDMLKTEYGVL